MNSEQLSAILMGCAKNNPKAKEALYKWYAHDMMQLCVRYSPSKTDAQDLHQECFIKVFDKITSYKGDGSFEGWMKRIFINHCLNSFEKHKNNPIFSGSKMFYADLDECLSDDTGELPDDDTFDKALDNYTLDELLLMVDDLPTSSKAVFRLYYIDGQAHHKIADRLQISVSNSKILLHRAKKKLHHLIVEKVTQFN